MALPDDMRFLVSCEHGGNLIPSSYTALFLGQEALLSSHMGFDAGALTLARELAKALRAPLVASTTSRLLIDLNRSPGHPQLYSPIMRELPESGRREIKTRHYQPYRDQIQSAVETAIENSHCLLHISSHSFTPVLNGEIRNADIGLLYDPSRSSELNLCQRWQADLETDLPGIRVRRNYPYTGKSDGLCSYLRKRFSGTNYLGIELEVNQKHVLKGGEDWHRLRAGIIASLIRALPQNLIKTAG